MAPAAALAGGPRHLGLLPGEARPGTAGIVPTGYCLGADRNTYVPCMGFGLLVGALALTVVLALRRGVLRTPIVAMALSDVAIWIGGLALTARAQPSVWHDSDTLWCYAIEVGPGCAICRRNLGVSLGRRGGLQASWGGRSRCDPTGWSSTTATGSS